MQRNIAHRNVDGVEKAEGDKDKLTPQIQPFGYVEATRAEKYTADGRTESVYGR